MMLSVESDSILEPPREGSSVHKKPNARIGRRDLLRVVTSGIAFAAIAAETPSSVAAVDAPKDRGKRKAQYQGNSEEVQNFYRVNRYPTK